MRERHFELHEVTRARFAVSPLWELAASLRVLAQGSAQVHMTWIRQSRAALASAGLDPWRLLLLAPVRGHIADLLTQAPRRRVNTIQDEIGRVAGAPEEQLVRDLDLLAADGAPPRAIREARSDPEAFQSRLVSDLEQYWHLALEGHWPRLRRLAEDDIAWRLERIGAHGTRAALGSLHPRVMLTDTCLTVRSTCVSSRQAPSGGGIVLVPCAFAWPEILLLDTPSGPPTLGYTSRGIGSLWQEPTATVQALPDLIGRTRAILLRMLDLPAGNSQLAEQLQLSPPSTNTHLHILHRAGLVDRRRQGRLVLYQRSALGTSLLNRSSEQHPQDGPQQTAPTWPDPAGESVVRAATTRA